MLKKLKIVKRKTKGYNVFNEYICPDFLTNTMSASEYVKYCWDKYTQANINHNNSLNGIIFELIISSLLVKEGILPLHLQAQVAFVPNAKFDAVLYTAEGPIALSLKTSLRERYKQADLEAVALKYVHRKAENYLFTMDEQEANTVSRKIKNGDLLGLNQAILTTDDSFDSFITNLKTKCFMAPGKVDVITAASVITPEMVSKITE
ncbi:hypothetical protein [Ruminococcus bovis]|uniref:Uncharacterized protein n=2 Tax=Ruminococcus TaxID=1263 RepID=A0A4P8XXD7_9FIRM|nr:hypothetical protein [Ruminococcus bovis]QCT06819.1 hypothetical protein E5Z56_05330 [Ruminococcus bovis]